MVPGFGYLASSHDAATENVSPRKVPATDQSDLEKVQIIMFMEERKEKPIFLRVQ